MIGCLLFERQNIIPLKVAIYIYLMGASACLKQNVYQSLIG